jgi:hypothetical protein
MTELQTSAHTAAALARHQRFLREGRCVWRHLWRHELLLLGEECLAMDWLDPLTARVLPGNAVFDPDGILRTGRLLAAFIPPVLTTAPLSVGDRPAHAQDTHFWQYPCATERQALDNHLRLVPGAHIDEGARTLATYLGLPWATYLDKAQALDDVVAGLQQRVRSLSLLAQQRGWRLQVHTVCQHIAWRDLLPAWRALGVTDLHLSHAERDPAAHPGQGGPRCHGWPLIAPNVEVPERRIGLSLGKPSAQRRWLASFVGAQMPHYRSDVRVRLQELARARTQGDVWVEVLTEWHFEKLVYGDQVGRHPARNAEDRQREAAATEHYNQILSDSVFALCPEGAGPNTLRLWEALAVGAIPVVMAPQWQAPELRDPSAPDWSDACLFVTPSELPGLWDRLDATPAARRQAMQAAAMRLYALARQHTAFGGLPGPHQAAAPSHGSVQGRTAP